MLVGPGTLTAEELEAGDKGYWKRFDDYVDREDVPILISPANYMRLCAWCDPFMDRRHEVQGAVTFHAGDRGIEIERVYVMGGNSVSMRTSCLLDPEDMLRQMQADYPERVAFISDQVGWWHLHPGYFSALSVGDVEECRKALAPAPDAKVLQLLMYGDGLGGGYQLSGYAVGLEEVNRFPVRMMDAG